MRRQKKVLLTKRTRISDVDRTRGKLPKEITLKEKRTIVAMCMSKMDVAFDFHLKL